LAHSGDALVYAPGLPLGRACVVYGIKGQALRADALCAAAGAVPVTGRVGEEGGVGCRVRT
jgi:hypothetical protein